VLAAISALISLAAAAARCARLRTSPATTAKPRPDSPARAASMSCSIDATVSSNALACSSVRRLRSALPGAICARAVATDLVTDQVDGDGALQLLEHDALP